MTGLAGWNFTQFCQPAELLPFFSTSAGKLTPVLRRLLLELHVPSADHAHPSHQPRHSPGFMGGRLPWLVVYQEWA
ncbi:MAG: hypothetical protein ACLUVG_21040 [Phocaeicola vulgatus]